MWRGAGGAVIMVLHGVSLLSWCGVGLASLVGWFVLVLVELPQCEAPVPDAGAFASQSS